MRSADQRRRASELMAEGERARDEGERAGAERSFRAALSLFVQLEDTHAAASALAALADLSMAEGRLGSATDLWRQAVARAPGDVEALTGLGYAQWLSGSPADAEATLEQALTRNRSAARALAGRGQVRAELGSYDAALADLDRALELGLPAADETDTRTARALAFAGLGEFARAEAEIAAELERVPDRPRTHLRAGRIAVFAGRPQQAKDRLTRVTELDQDQAAVETEQARRILERLERSVGGDE
ncbi:tetratricopeptide repeat protein [Actinomadura fibrosa]|uniref:Tetratricopeptide repeat protein n=1 Tax=Actinomadura fibrosa TaxID=111802 RepID=A0ABW2XEL8_9ACTN|nr:tetratricopeptide repeat protein [Actinomadura fibrosa]